MRISRSSKMMIVMFIAVVSLSGCASTMSKAMYLDEGMTKEQVRQKLGSPKAASTIKKDGEVWESWDYPQNSLNPMDAFDTRVIFVNGKLREWGKSQDISIR